MAPREARITRAQGKVLRQLMLDGATNAEIATRLFLAEYTVKCHMKALLTATGCANRTALAVDLFRGRVVVYCDQDEP